MTYVDSGIFSVLQTNCRIGTHETQGTGKKNSPTQGCGKDGRKIALLRSPLGFLHRCEMKNWEGTVFSRDTILFSLGKLEL
jgi:hypothetical protein